MCGGLGRRQGPFRDKGNAPCLVLSGIYTATYICPKPLNWMKTYSLCKLLYHNYLSVKHLCQEIEKNTWEIHILVHAPDPTPDSCKTIQVNLHAVLSAGTVWWEMALDVSWCGEWRGPFAGQRETPREGPRGTRHLHLWATPFHLPLSPTGSLELLVCMLSFI